MREKVYLLEHISKLYNGDQERAVELLQQGAGKNQVLKETGCTVALWDVNIEVRRGQIFVIIGLSGSGKSTLLRCFNRLLEPSEGKLYYRGENILEYDSNELLNYRRKHVAMVFQSFALMNHRNVLSNVAYPLEVQGVAKEERETKAKKYLDMVGLHNLDNVSCDSLSGGMRQRVGIARALCSDADILLMDEPFSALDPLVRSDMQFELLRLQRKLGKTVIFITHDIDEAFKLGDRVVIMRDGRIVQNATPVEMSKNPQDEYVKKFIEFADKSKVLTAKDIMINPESLIRCCDTPEYALKEMGTHEISSAYVVDNKLHLVGILSIGDAIKAHVEKKGIAESMATNLKTVGLDTPVSELIPMAAETPFPIAVVDEENMLQGLVTKAGVLSIFD